MIVILACGCFVAGVPTRADCLPFGGVLASFFRVVQSFGPSPRHRPGPGSGGLSQRPISARPIGYDPGYIGQEQKTLQAIDNPFGTRLSPMS
ncbi:hypothetical protein [Lichenicoccus sp.]|uniref:hypothetical protein n=1 Tax=Lichenicoccus sp. TaxID=2781899 RepID=UPI003D0ADD1F